MSPIPIGLENEEVKFFTTTDASDGQGGTSATYTEINYNPVIVAVQSRRGSTRNLENGEVAFYSFKEISFRKNELWTPTKNMIIEMRGKKFAILSIDDDNNKDEYYFLSISEIDHA